ncbi:MAG: hypothetical protein Hyperionvirus6_85 [Hyperionvirus sp.]|uniref:Uncharacterized protein n=1 Tax=Hyperionvirus sp. TaxID=2487770 RepID=A0A3G5AA92_9VIRU|nr:MAG: hypothetical protein Hyperionvirus6_85 [Hyperionvirus sp.]
MAKLSDRIAKKQTLNFTKICLEEPFEVMKKFQSENEISKSDYVKAFEICCVNGYRDQAEWIFKLGVVDISPETISFRKIAENSQYGIIHWLLDNMDLSLWDKFDVSEIYIDSDITFAKILLDRLPKIDPDILKDLYEYVRDKEFLALLYKRHPVDMKVLGDIFMQYCIHGNLEGGKIFYELFKFDLRCITDCFYYAFCEMDPSYDVITWLLSIDKIDDDIVNRFSELYRDKQIEVMIKHGYAPKNKILLKRYTEYSKKHLIN